MSGQAPGRPRPKKGAPPVPPPAWTRRRVENVKNGAKPLRCPVPGRSLSLSARNGPTVGYCIMASLSCSRIKRTCPNKRARQLRNAMQQYPPSYGARCSARSALAPSRRARRSLPARLRLNQEQKALAVRACSHNIHGSRSGASCAAGSSAIHIMLSNCQMT